MARASKVVACMFCGEAPCVCNAKADAPKKPATRRRAPKSDVPIVDGAETEQRAAVKNRASSEIQKAVLTDVIRDSVTTRRQDAEVARQHKIDDEIAWILTDPEFVNAVKAVEPIMHPLERLRFAPVLAAPGLSPRERAARWKERIVNE